jgi:hypothetical protein
MTEAEATLIEAMISGEATKHTIGVVVAERLTHELRRDYLNALRTLQAASKEWSEVWKRLEAATGLKALNLSAVLDVVAKENGLENRW